MALFNLAREARASSEDSLYRFRVSSDWVFPIRHLARERRPDRGVAERVNSRPRTPENVTPLRISDSSDLWTLNAVISPAKVSRPPRHWPFSFVIPQFSAPRMKSLDAVGVARGRSSHQEQSLLRMRSRNAVCRPA